MVPKFMIKDVSMSFTSVPLITLDLPNLINRVAGSHFWGASGLCKEENEDKRG